MKIVIVEGYDASAMQYQSSLLFCLVSLSSFPLLSFLTDCIPRAESFPYENHHSQARTSLQVAGGKNETFFPNPFPFQPDLLQPWPSWVTFKSD